MLSEKDLVLPEDYYPGILCSSIIKALENDLREGKFK